MAGNNERTEINTVVTDQATAPGGHYSQATVFQNIIFVSGQLGFLPGTSDPVVGSVEEQTERCLSNLQQILRAAGSDLDRVIKTTIYISDVGFWPIVNRVYSDVFANHKPARAIVPCNKLHHGFDVEIEAIATQ